MILIFCYFRITPQYPLHCWGQKKSTLEGPPERPLLEHLLRTVHPLAFGCLSGHQGSELLGTAWQTRRAEISCSRTRKPDETGERPGNESTKGLYSDTTGLASASFAFTSDLEGLGCPAGGLYGGITTLIIL